MIKKDYIERLTEQIAQLIARLMGKNIKESLEIIEEAYTSWFKISADVLIDIKEEEIINFLSKEKNFHVYQLELLAEIMAKEGAVYFNKNEKNKSKNILKKALILFEFVDEKQQLYSLERLSTIKKIKNQLSVLTTE